MNVIKEKKIVYYFFIIVLYFFVFQNLIQQYFEFAKYFDEILALLVIPIIIERSFTKQWKIKKIDFMIIICLFGIFAVGIYANLNYKYQPLYIAFADAFLVFKFFLVYYLFQRINKKRILQYYSDNIVKHIDIIINSFFILTIANYIIKIFPSEQRYGIMVNKLFYGVPSYLSAVCIFLMCLRIYFKGKINSVQTFMLVIIIFTTLRVKAIGFLVIFIIMAIYVSKSEKRITFSKISILGLICIVIAYQQIEYYFIETNDSARASLLTTSFKIANDYAPIGTGFATFASYFSGESYSPIYYIYGIQDVYGITKEKHNFISDSFWPMIIGQFGYIGTFLYLIIILLFFRKIQLQYKRENKYEYIAKVVALVYLIISSTSESAFANSFAIGLAIVLAI